MKKLLILILGLFFISNLSNAQKQYLTNQYVYDLFQINSSAAAFHKNCFTINGFIQKQWFGTDLSPTTQIFSFQTALKGALGSGTYIFNDRNGFYRHIGLHQAFSYEILLVKKRNRVVTLSFGLAADVEQTSLNKTELTPGYELDPVMSGGNENGWGYNASTGILIKYNNMHLGFSVDNLLPQTNPMFKTEYEPELTPDFYIHAGGTFKAGDRDLFLEPLLMYQRISVVSSRFDINLKLYIPTPNENVSVWGILAYQHVLDDSFGKSLSTIITAGIVYKNFSIGIEYKLGLTSAQADYGSSYQLILSYRKCKDRSKSPIPCSHVRRNKKHNVRFVSY